MTLRDTVCWHCGEPLPTGDVLYATIAGQARALCCQGCKAAAEWIEQLGLGDYYRLRTAPAQKPSPYSNGNNSSDNADRAWSRPEVARHVVRELGASRCETMLLIEGVRCSACVWLIERALGTLAGVVSVQVNVAARRARIVWRDSEISLPKILGQLSRTGYRALPLDAKALDDVRRRESRDALKRLAVAGLGAMQAMMFATVLYLSGADSIDRSTIDLFRWFGFLVAIPVVFYSAQPFFAGALRCLKARRLGMDVPVALGIAIIFSASLIEALRGDGDVYFDSVSMFVFFLLAGRYLEMSARHRAGHLTDALARLTPSCADRRRADGTLERVGIHELQPGDCIQVGEGGIVPADGVLLSERCQVDEAILTGESEFVTKRRNDSLIAGSVLVDGMVEMRVRRIGAETALAGIAALVERAQAQRPQLAQAGERTTRHFVARVLVLTAATVAVWSFFDPSRAFGAALAVLVVSCPCAFALAVPAAITRALAVLARRGVLVVNPDAIQSLAEATHIVFDKTGTLTEPHLALVDVESLNGASRHEALRLAASLARASRHPVARAIESAHLDGALVESGLDAAIDVSSRTGFGISGTVAGRELRLGRADFALPGEQVMTSIHAGAVILADADGPIAAFNLNERLRPNTAAAVEALRTQGLSIFIASGDAATKVADIAARLGIVDWRARQLPADKLDLLTQLRASGARVIAVGDGVNDAPVLAGSDVAIALAGGADLAQTSSDVVLAGGRLDAIAPARVLARQTLAILKQNQRWAMIYNLTAVPLAALGFVPPWLAALGMSLSSLCVILNAMRIGRGAVNRAANPPVIADGIEHRVGVA
jgi:Cu2+-exporting ATPase